MPAKGRGPSRRNGNRASPVSDELRPRAHDKKPHGRVPGIPGAVTCPDIQHASVSYRHAGRAVIEDEFQCALEDVDDMRPLAPVRVFKSRCELEQDHRLIADELLLLKRMGA